MFKKNGQGKSLGVVQPALVQEKLPTPPVHVKADEKESIPKPVEKT